MPVNAYMHALIRVTIVISVRLLYSFVVLGHIFPHMAAFLYIEKLRRLALMRNTILMDSFFTIMLLSPRQ